MLTDATCLNFFIVMYRLVLIPGTMYIPIFQRYEIEIFSPNIFCLLIFVLLNSTTAFIVYTQILS